MAFNVFLTEIQQMSSEMSPTLRNTYIALKTDFHCNKQMNIDKTGSKVMSVNHSIIDSSAICLTKV